jgi:hypothetical protein
MDVVDITKNSMREAFASYAQVHEAASIRRCCRQFSLSRKNRDAPSLLAHMADR